MAERQCRISVKTLRQQHFAFNTGINQCQLTAVGMPKEEMKTYLNNKKEIKSTIAAMKTIWQLKGSN